jgi:cobalamin biosynthesis protein CobD/CbiB
MEATTRRPDRALLVVIIAVAALVVLALVVVLTRGAAAPLDPSTPAGVVQRYTAAVIEGDEEAAREHLVDEARDGCERLEPGSLDDVRVTLADTVERDGTADVDVSIVTTSGGGLFGPSEYREEATFDLERTESGWRIASAPWQLAICAQATP